MNAIDTGPRRPPPRNALNQLIVFKEKPSLVSVIVGIKGEKTAEVITAIMVREGVIDKEIRDAPVERFATMPKEIENNRQFVYKHLNEILSLIELCERERIETIKKFLDWSGKDKSFLPLETVRAILCGNESLIQEMFKDYESAGVRKLFQYFKSDSINERSYTFKFINKATYKALVNAHKEKPENDKWLSYDEIRAILKQNLVNDAEVEREIDLVDEEHANEEVLARDSPIKVNNVNLGGAVHHCPINVIDSDVLNSSGISSALNEPLGNNGQFSSSGPSTRPAPTQTSTIPRSTVNSRSSIPLPPQSHFNKYWYIYAALSVLVVLGGAALIYKDKFTSTDETDL